MYHFSDQNIIRIASPVSVTVIVAASAIGRIAASASRQLKSFATVRV